MNITAVYVKTKKILIKIKHLKTKTGKNQRAKQKLKKEKILVFYEK